LPDYSGRVVVKEKQFMPLLYTKLITIVSLLMLAVLSLAQPALESEHVLGIDDLIEISVPSHDGLDRQVVVQGDGTVSYPEVGTLNAAGKTASALADEIRTALERTRNNVRVIVTIKEIRSRKARIVGPVKSPGAYDMKPGWRILDLIAAAGGLDARAQRVTGRVIRGTSDVLSFEVSAASASPHSASNPEVLPNDLVYLEERDPALSKVFVMGQVARPGAYDIGEQGSNIAVLLSQAGNTTEFAALTRVTIMRGNDVLPLNLQPMIESGTLTDEIRSFRLMPGDVLFVPDIEGRVTIMGQVNKPGRYPLPETKELTALDALSIAGGQTQNGDLIRAGVIRVVDGTAQVIPVNIADMMRSKRTDANIVLQANDVLFIPAKDDRRFEWRNILGPLSILSFLGIR
jgi:protein involved in polysaccharide export with SLBB domain